MLKKIVKYGNSSAIVLDKAILELLNMHEGSIVKISTDGKSLLLTPHEPTPIEHVSPTVTSQEVFLARSVECLRKNLTEPDKNLNDQELQKVVEGVKKKMTDYADQFVALESDDAYQKEYALLKEKYKDTPITLKNEITALQERWAPQLCTMGKKLDASPTTRAGQEVLKQATDYFGEEAETLQRAYMAIHEKYKSARDAFTQLQNNEEYQHENALLTQQQTNPINMEKYIADTMELLCKYIPEWRAYQNEIQKTTKDFAEKAEKHKTHKKTV